MWERLGVVSTLLGLVTEHMQVPVLVNIRPVSLKRYLIMFSHYRVLYSSTYLTHIPQYRYLHISSHLPPYPSTCLHCVHYLPVYTPSLITLSITFSIVSIVLKSVKPYEAI